MIAAEEGYVQVSVTEGRKQDENPSINSGQAVKLTARRIGRDWLIVLVNESNEICMGIEVTGLIDLEGTEFVLLYGNESITITRGELVTRMMPHQVRFLRQVENGKPIGVKGGILSNKCYWETL